MTFRNKANATEKARYHVKQKLSSQIRLLGARNSGCCSDTLATEFLRP